MNKILFWLLSLLLLHFSAPLRAQKQGIEIDEPPTPPFLLGDITQSDLKQGSYASWFQPAYQAYSPSPAATAKLEKALADKDFLLFLGTWCGDSKREVPRMLKLLNLSGVDLDRIRIIALDRRPGKYKSSPGKLEKEFDIKRVPTLIVLSQGREINRLVERPWESLEADLLRISRQAHYSPRYSR